MIAQNYLDEFAWFGSRAYLDCSTMGMQPERTRRIAREFLDRFADSMGLDPKTDREWVHPFAKKEIARLINADPSDIFFTRNTTEGNNLLARGLALNPGDEVIVSNEDFPSVYLPWTTRQAEGVKLVIVPCLNGVVSAQELIAHFTDRTRVVCVSMVQSSSGYLIDLYRLGDACRQRGILLSVDGVQGLGRGPVDVEKMHIDVLASASFKHLLGTLGAGFCWCRREVMERITPPVVSGNLDWNTISVAEGFISLPVPGFPSGAARMETGTSNNYGIRLMGESVRLLNEIGVENIAERIREVEAYYRKRLLEAGLQDTLLGSPEKEHWSGTVSIRYDASRAEELEEALKEAEVYAAVRETYFRMSLHYYSTEEHVDRLMHVLKKVLIH